MKNRTTAAAGLCCATIVFLNAFAAQVHSSRIQGNPLGGGPAANISSHSTGLGQLVPVVYQIADDSGGNVVSSSNFVSFRSPESSPVDYTLMLHNLADAITRDLGLAVRSLDQSGPSVQANMPLYVSETSQAAQDLNGDGDTLDDVLFLLDTASYTSRSTGIAADYCEAFGPLLLLSVLESADNKDWDGNGVIANRAYLLMDPTDESVVGTLPGAGGILRQGSVLALTISEADFASIPIDLTGDGDSDDDVPFLVDANTGVTALLPVPASFGSMQLLDDSLYMQVKEKDWSMDLDGDGVQTSTILVRYDFQTGLIQDLGVQVNPFGLPTLRDFESGTLFPWLEAGKVDLNGDGDMLDAIHTVYVDATDQVVPLGLASSSTFAADHAYEAAPGILVVDVVESSQSADLNGDGDQNDKLWVLFDTVSLSQTVIPFAADQGFSPLLRGDRFLFALSEKDENSAAGGDLNGDGLLAGGILHAYDISTGSLVNSGLRIDSPLNTDPVLINDSLLLVLDESYDGIDRTGNGLATDQALALVSPDDFTVTPFGLSVTGLNLPETSIGVPIPGSGPPVIQRSEAGLAEDLNGDGDQDDEALYLLGNR